MSFSVYSRITKQYKYQALDTTMTGFGPTADAEALTKSEESSTNVAIPPYVLAPSRDHLNSSDATPIEDKSTTLFCSYCLSEDQRWLLACVVRDNGEVQKHAALYFYSTLIQTISWGYIDVITLMTALLHVYSWDCILVEVWSFSVGFAAISVNFVTLVLTLLF